MTLINKLKNHFKAKQKQQREDQPFSLWLWETAAIKLNEEEKVYNGLTLKFAEDEIQLIKDGDVQPFLTFQNTLYNKAYLLWFCQSKFKPLITSVYHTAKGVPVELSIKKENLFETIDYELLIMQTNGVNIAEELFDGHVYGLKGLINKLKNLESNK
jgi:hypothetical protein|nr:MAG TPA: hypothetical protein [Caudoviricetes sp.]